MLSVHALAVALVLAASPGPGPGAAPDEEHRPSGPAAPSVPENPLPPSNPALRPPEDPSAPALPPGAGPVFEAVEQTPAQHRPRPAAARAKADPMTPFRPGPAEADAAESAAAGSGPAADTATGAFVRAEGHVVPGATPPNLTARALADELRRGAKDNRAERSATEGERQKLEALQGEIARQRTALQAETARLQALLAQGAGRDTRKTKKLAPGQKAEPTPVESIARTLKGMKPDQAAQLLARLDRGLATAILRSMKPVDAALIVEKMETGAGAELLGLLSRSPTS